MKPLLVILLLLTGCGVLAPSGDTSHLPPDVAQAIPFDASLWRAARETIAFLPLEASDPIAGTLQTAWGSTRGSDGPRFRVQIILDYSTGIAQVAVERQVVAGDDLSLGVPDPRAAAGLQRAIARYAQQLRRAEIAAK